MHACTSKDMQHFYPPSTKFVENKVAKAIESDSIFCLDYSELNLAIQGSWKDGKAYQVLDVMLIPCATKIELHDGTIIGGEDDCVWDR